MTTGPVTGISAVASPAGVPVRAVTIIVTVAGAEARALEAAYRVTLPGQSKGVSFGLFLVFFISRIWCWGKCRFLLSLSVINITAENMMGTEQVSQTVFASTVSGWEDKETLLIMLGHIWFP